MQNRWRAAVSAALCLAAPLFGLDAPFSAYARYFGADCRPVPDLKAIGTCPRDTASQEVFRLLWGTADFEDNLTPLVDADDLRNYSKVFLQEVVRVVEGGTKFDRLRLINDHQEVINSLSEEKEDLKAFYFMRMLSLETEDTSEFQRDRTIVEALFRLLSKRTLIILGFCLIPLFLAGAWASAWQPEEEIEEWEIDEEQREDRESGITV